MAKKKTTAKFIGKVDS